MIKRLFTALMMLMGFINAFAQSADSVQNAGSRYLVYLPETYDSIIKSYPLMIFLHGSGERGNNLELVKKHGPPKLASEGKQFPFILIAPQCAENDWWQAAQIKLILDDVLKKYRVNKDRIFITGQNMGGYGTWDFATLYPEIPAAIIPICGGGDPDKACNFKDVPTRVFHGADDKSVPLFKSEEMVKALERCGADVKLTVYPNTGHDSWTATYLNPKMYEWLAIQKKITPWDKDFNQYLAEEKRKAIKPNGILFIGSSVIKNWTTVESTYRNQNAVVRGFKGFQFSDMNDYLLDWIVRYQPKQLVIYAGDNDLASGKSVNEVKKSFVALFGKIRTYLPQTRIIIISIKPSPLRRMMDKAEDIETLNRGIELFLNDKENTVFLNVHPKMITNRKEPIYTLYQNNGLYLSKEGYKLWSELLFEVLPK